MRLRPVAPTRVVGGVTAASTSRISSVRTTVSVSIPHASSVRARSASRSRGSASAPPVLRRPDVNECRRLDRAAEVPEGVERPVGVFREVRREEESMKQAFAADRRVVGPTLDAGDQ
jgi:hypothetical protein